ncbi:MAG TPA: fumarylacetoacetase [Cryptosporangiaceae bacterium]|nr:fumarylacetoacetase [Cryptosporangiaceae bacterium]
MPGGSGFGLTHLPYGVIARDDGPARPVVRIGDLALRLDGVAETGLFDGAVSGTREMFGAPRLNAFMAAGPAVWRGVRSRLRTLLGDVSWRPQLEPLLVPLADVRPVLPFEVADYVDFYSSEHHATNVGRIFRPDADDPLPRNWKHLPAGYHGRAGTVVVSGTDIVRPCGQRLREGADTPEDGPSLRLDLEAEVAFVVGVPSPPGSRLPTGDFANHVFGVALLNDWSARDLQAWEYVPLGPFLGKSFATSLAAWITPLEALDAARVPTPPQHPEPLPYLAETEPWGLDLALAVRWNGEVVSRPPFRTTYWSPAQQLAHLTSNGAALRTGDLYASGTVSGPERDAWGSLLELTWNGTEPVAFADGATRTFLEDGDEVVITATAPGEDGEPLTLAEVAGRIVPARP